MKYPEKPSCHSGNEGVFTGRLEASWREPTASQSYRTCYYCGSIHPEDLLRLLKAGAKLRGADWKYGWPHKFYVEQPFAKWYNAHLQDEGYDEEAWNAIAGALKASGIEWRRDEKGVKWAAPCDGYQR